MDIGELSDSVARGQRMDESSTGADYDLDGRDAQMSDGTNDKCTCPNNTTAHFAVFPPKLVEPMILASTSAKGVCAECGSPYARVTRTRSNPAGITGGRHREVARPEGISDRSGRDYEAERTAGVVEEIGWTATCAHEAGVIPATVLDIFGGSGTTAMVAASLGRRAILIDLSEDYLDQQRKRNAQVPLGLGA